MTQTVRYSALTPDTFRYGGRFHRILRAVADGPRSTGEVLKAARNRENPNFHKEFKKTKTALYCLLSRDWISWSDNRISITDQGLTVLSQNERRAA